MKMKNLFFVFFIASSTLIFSNSEWSGIVKKDKKSIKYQWSEKEPLPEEREVFIKAFSYAYQNLSNEQLGIKNLQDFLNEAFNEEVEAINDPKQKIYHLIVKDSEEKPIAFATFNQEDPDKVYIRQMAVDPDWSRNGIGKEVVFSITKQLPKTKKLVLVTRRMNNVACNFYKSVGFKESTYIHEGLDPKKYVGFEYALS